MENSDTERDLARIVARHIAETMVGMSADWDVVATADQIEAEILAQLKARGTPVGPKDTEVGQE